MNPFEEASGIENEALQILIPYCVSFCESKNQIVSTTGQLFAQKFVGDLVAKFKSTDKAKSIEVKSEARNRYGNLFLESWSNKSMWSLGWLYTSQADLLWYYFVEDDELYVVRVEELRRWCFGFNGEGNVYRYDEKPQSKYTQRNDTWGWCVPIADLSGVSSFKGPLSPRSKMTVEATN